jgi:putative membrane protein
MRARALVRVSTGAALVPVFAADNLWGIAAVLWISSGLWRAFGGLEKGTGYYLRDHAFYVKMGLLVLILLLESWPMSTLIRWRVRVRRGSSVDRQTALILARLSDLQVGLLILMVFAATAVARAYFY